MKIYLVMGETGQHEDRHEWTVAAYKKKETAERHAELAQQFLIDTNAKENGGFGWKKIATPYDPQANCDYTGTTYGVVEVDLLEKIPKGNPPPASNG